MRSDGRAVGRFWEERLYGGPMGRLDHLADCLARREQLTYYLSNTSRSGIRLPGSAGRVPVVEASRGRDVHTHHR